MRKAQQFEETVQNQSRPYENPSNPYYQADYPSNPAAYNYFQPNVPVVSSTPSSVITNFQNPILQDLAVNYTNDVMQKGKDVIDQELNKYISASKVKYYFSVDTAYVAKKVGLLMFPFAHRDWAIKFNPEEPVQPRYELNAPDLYIPVMAYVTFILTSGISLGLKNQFSPEMLGLQASSVMMWAFLELFVIWFSLYVMSIQTHLKIFDILAFSSYKYIGMIWTILATFLFPFAYHAVLTYASLAIIYFLIRSLRARLLVESTSSSSYGIDSGLPVASAKNTGSKRRAYLLLLIVSFQPLLMWLLTRNLAIQNSVDSMVDP